MCTTHRDGHRRRGHVVLYTYLAGIGTMFILAVRDQRQQRQR